MFRVSSLLFLSPLIAVVVFIAALAVSEAPQFWASIVLATLCFAAMRRSRTVGERALWWNLAAVLGLWAVFDGIAILWMGHGVGAVVPRALAVNRLARFIPTVELDIRDPFLGVRYSPGAHEQDGELSYTIDSYGLRVSPPTPTAVLEPRGCVLFFGCSYTFGVGISDEQTFPFRVSAKTDGRFETRNFGVGGSAPHYALAQVESGFVERAVHCVPTHAVYLVLPHHLTRVSGKFAVRFGPRYVLQPDGEVRRDGSLNRTTGEFVWDMLRYTSALYVAKFGYDTAVNIDDGRLLVALLKELRARLLERYPGIQFDVIYWDEPPLPHFDELLQTTGAPLHKVSTILPEIHQTDGPAYLRGDQHPSPWAHEKVADYVVGEILHLSPIH